MTAFILAIGSGAQIELDEALLGLGLERPILPKYTAQTHIKPSIDPEIASLESRVGLCNALAVALTQSLVWLHIDEVQRIALAMNTLAKLDLLVFGEFVGHRAYFELLRKSTELVFDDQGNGYRPELDSIFQNPQIRTFLHSMHLIRV